MRNHKRTIEVNSTPIILTVLMGVALLLLVPAFLITVAVHWAWMVILVPMFSFPVINHFQVFAILVLLRIVCAIVRGK